MALILVTGASTGLGLAAATQLSADGHDVVLHVRNKNRLERVDVLDRLHGAVFGDVSHLDECVRVGEQANAYGRFDAVIHNAGTMDGSRVIPVNVVAPYALTATMPMPERVIVLSSSMHLAGHANVDPMSFGRGSYADSKLLVTTTALALARLYPALLSHAVDPGWVPTRMGGPSAPDDLAEGHRTQTWLATAPAADVTPHTGGYWRHFRARRSHPATLDEDFQDELLDVLRVRTGLGLPSRRTPDTQA